MDFATWLEAHATFLTRAAAETFSQDQMLQTQVAEVVEGFYDALLRSAHTYDPTPMYKLLFDWVDTKTDPIGDETGSLFEGCQLKLATLEETARPCASKDTVGLFLAADTIYTDAFIFLAAVEADVQQAYANAQLAISEKQRAVVRVSACPSRSA